MKDGFIQVGTRSPIVKVADIFYKKNEKINACKKTDFVKVLVFPSICLTSSTCRDLFYQDALLSLDSLKKIKEETQDLVDSYILHDFHRYYFIQQFRNSYMKEGKKEDGISLLPRTLHSMLSDDLCNLWLKELEENT